MTDRPDTLAQTIRDGLQNSHSATLCALADDALNELLRLLEQRTALTALQRIAFTECDARDVALDALHGLGFEAMREQEPQP